MNPRTVGSELQRRFKEKLLRSDDAWWHNTLWRTCLSWPCMIALTGDPYSPDPVFQSFHSCCCCHHSCPTSSPPPALWSPAAPPAASSSWSSAPAPALPRRSRPAGPTGGWQPSRAWISKQVDCSHQERISTAALFHTRLSELPSMTSAAVRKKQTAWAHWAPTHSL